MPSLYHLRSCDNWQGIALLYLTPSVGSARGVAAQTRPSNVVRQLAEKAIEHRAQQFLIYVNLKKAYDSVPREALWVAMQKLGDRHCEVIP